VPREQVDLTATDAHALAREVRVLVGQLRRKLREQAEPGDFTPSQVAALLRLLTDGPTTLTALARAEGMRPQSMGAIVSALDAVGLVSSEPDPTDGRQSILSATPEARHMVEAGRAAKEDWLSRTIESRLSEREQRDLSAGIELLKRLLDP
jgi:DNA-binding MarR family transcriptional regulator